MEKPTKMLARQLGAVSQISAKPRSKLDTHIESCLPLQKFEYLIVLDFESTCWEDRGKQNPSPEIIEFPAVLLNLKTGKIEDKFQQYVFPIEQPRLSAFCQQFTGITQNIVEKGVPLATCLVLFMDWVETLVVKHNLEFHIPKCNNQQSSLCTLVTWSDWDLTLCLGNECRRKNILKPKLFNSWIDLRLVYKQFFNRLTNGLRGAMEDIGLQFEGQEHCGLVDSVNTARLAYKMVQEGCVLEITRST